MAKVRKPKISVNRIRTAASHGTAEKNVIVLHTTESHDRPGVDDIKGILKYLESVGLGVQFVVDGDGNVGQGAKVRHIVYHARGANTHGIGIEQIGTAAWKTKRWLWDPTPTGRKQRKQLARVAHLLAWLSQREGIPLVHSTVHGVARHSDFPAGGHSDPGAGYPLGYVLKRARKMKRTGKVPA